MIRVKILYRYIAREYLFAFAGIAGLSAMLFGLNLFFDKFEDFVDNQALASDAAFYILYSLPGEMIELMPLLVMLAVLFGIGVMSKNNEILAMHACGVSYTRLGFPVFLCAAGISALAFVFSETVLPACEQQRRIVDARIKNRDLNETNQERYEPTRKWIYMTESFNAHTMTMTNPTVIFLGEEGGRVRWKITAEKGILESTGETEDVWRMENAYIWVFDREGKAAGDADFQNVRRVRLGKHLDKLLGPEKKPEQMNLAELATHISVLRKNGERPLQFETFLQKRLAFPFSALILALIGYTIAVRAHVRPMTVGFSYGLAAGFIYYLLDAAFSSFGEKGLISPIAAGWIPNMAFFGFAVYRIRYMNQVRD